MASLLLWAGVELAKRIAWFLPYSGGLGFSLIALGYLLEIRKAHLRHEPANPVNWSHPDTDTVC